jgi:hypothetical protein
LDGRDSDGVGSEISWAAAYKIPIHSLFALPDILEDAENGLPPLARETLDAGYETIQTAISKAKSSHDSAILLLRGSCPSAMRNCAPICASFLR